MKTRPSIIKDYLVKIYRVICVLFVIFIAVAEVIITIVTAILIFCLAVLSLENKNADKQRLIKYPPPQNTNKVNTSPQAAVNLTNIPINTHNNNPTKHLNHHHVYFREHYNLLNYSDEITLT